LFVYDGKGGGVSFGVKVLTLISVRAGTQPRYP
jgi:hypothetical protein